MAALPVIFTFSCMNTQHPTQRVEIRCVGTPPVRALNRAAGVSDIEIDGPILRCVVTGSFQPFLEALHGHEVISLQSTPTPQPPSSPRIEGDL